MKKLISLFSIISLFSFAIACNMNDRQNEEVKDMNTTDERIQGETNDVMDDQRMEESYQENDERLEKDIQRDVDKTQEGEATNPR